MFAKKYLIHINSRIGILRCIPVLLSGPDACISLYCVSSKGGRILDIAGWEQWRFVLREILKIMPEVRSISLRSWQTKTQISRDSLKNCRAETFQNSG